VTRPIVFLTDYGLDDEYVGVCHGVIARIAPDARVIDLSHGIPPQDVVRGALVLARAVPYMPEDAVVLAVVDPEVGGDRGAIAVRTADGTLLIGPDNGLLSLAWQELGGPEAAVEIAAPDVLLQPVSATFHGRDVFAPAAAHLSTGRPLEDLGPPVDASALQHVEIAAPGIADGELAAVAMAVDRFGNVQLNARPDDLAEAGLSGADRLRVRHAGGGADARPARTFADGMPGELLLVEDSSGYLALVANHGSAADVLGVGPGHELTLLR
jgi:S-adenosyl-L-methionine hydrolase (adenosine-forming)